MPRVLALIEHAVAVRVELHEDLTHRILRLDRLLVHERLCWIKWFVIGVALHRGCPLIRIECPAALDDFDELVAQSVRHVVVEPATVRRTVTMT